MINFHEPAQFDKKGTIVLISEEQAKSKKYAINNKKIISELNFLVKAKQFNGENGQCFPLVHNDRVILLAGIGKKKNFSLSMLRIIVRNTVSSGNLRMIKDIEIIPFEKKDEVVQAIIDGVIIGTYKWRKYLSKKEDDKGIIDKNVTVAVKKKKLYDDIVKICEATNTARNLINENADIANSVFIEKEIRRIIKGQKKFSLKVLDEKELKKEGLGLHLAVNQGSRSEPKLIIVKYSGGTASSETTAVVGKGVTFDTGGINLKPSGHLETMRMDMSGTAAVVGLIKAMVSLKPKLNIIFVCALAENAISAHAYKPGDVIMGYAGKTVEVLNTDAEGRLVLADAISYIVKNYKPNKLIDIATLTGACIVALGHDYTGLVSNDDKFSRDLVRASNDSDDRIWRLPTYPELKYSVESKIADIKNLGFPGGAGGAITAAEFLRQFTGNTTWAHLDIAGTAFVDGESRQYFRHGGTGAGVRLLSYYFLNK